MSRSVDILDQRGRLKRFAISMTLAILAGLGSWMLAEKIVQPKYDAFTTRFGGDGSFVAMCGFFGFVAVYFGTQWFLKRLARWRDFPAASVRRDSQP